MRTLNGSNIVQVKSQNRQAILLQLLRSPLSRVELAHRLNVSGTTVTNLVNELLEEGWVVSENAGIFQHTKPGRPRTQLHIVPQANYAIGVHIGIGTYRVAQVDLLGEVVNSLTGTFAVGEDAETVIAGISHTIQQLTIHLQPNQILGIGVGASGLVDAKRGVNQFAPSLGWQNVPIAALLQAQTKLPVVVENNVRAMALAESYFGQGVDVESLAFIYGRIGIAAGLVMGGKLVRGAGAGAGEIGHTKMMLNDGQLCRCGQVGCLETLVTQPVLARNLGLADGEARAQFDEVLRLANDNNPETNSLARTQLQQLTHYLGIALTNLVNTLNPKLIIVGGMYAQGAHYFIPHLRQQIAQSTFGNLGENIQIEATTFGLNAGVIGAASVALVNLFYETA
jgi:predicted NBD/HSP70 family sugar kinase/biotin operon repressor